MADSERQPLDALREPGHQCPDLGPYVVETIRYVPVAEVERLRALLKRASNYCMDRHPLIEEIRAEFQRSITGGMEP